ncbi:hypothetical protein OH77DRAFT_619798 [Trametes cingulata]|nr:hypothetical protein OH77DRAFT_619798 [Trametes cingulata]
MRSPTPTPSHSGSPSSSPRINGDALDPPKADASVVEHGLSEGDTACKRVHTVPVANQNLEMRHVAQRPEAGPSRLAMSSQKVDAPHSHGQKRSRDQFEDQADKENMPAVDQSLPPSIDPPAKRARLEVPQPAAPVPEPGPATPGPVCGMDRGQCAHQLTGDNDVDHRHLNSHGDYVDGRWRCTYLDCSAHYKEKCNVGKHVISKHWGRRFMCDVPGCGKTYATKAEIPRHKRKAHPS